MGHDGVLYIKIVYNCSENWRDERQIFFQCLWKKIKGEKEKEPIIVDLLLQTIYQ